MTIAITKHADVVVVGSGPGGATVARGLARRGRKVILLERGKDWRRSPLHGTYPGALLYTDRAALLFTREGLNIIRPLMAGGATSMYCGCADPDSIFVTPMRGTHPCATVRIGEMLDKNLQTEIENLYVCDASAFPEALDRPTVLTIIGMGKRLVDYLSK